MAHTCYTVPTIILLWTIFNRAVLHIPCIAAPEIRTTMYSVMNSLHFAVGAIVANTLGGKLYKVYGGKTLFTIVSVEALISGTIFTVFCIF